MKEVHIFQFKELNSLSGKGPGEQKVRMDLNYFKMIWYINKFNY